MTAPSGIRRALIVGISGQDGAYLSSFLLSKGYEVWGTSRDVDSNGFRSLERLGIKDKVHLLPMNPHDFPGVMRTFSDLMPTEVYNLSGQSSVSRSFEDPLGTECSISRSTISQLEAIRVLDRGIRFFNASSSEIFGDPPLGSANEGTACDPQSPYGAAKAAALWHTVAYRRSFGIFASNGILFNHESPLRSERFVSMKIVAAAVRIARGSGERLQLGSLSVRRDWGWAPEYVEAMWQILNYDTADDFVLATGISQSLEEFVAEAFSAVGLDWREHVDEGAIAVRRVDPRGFSGDAGKAARLLGWRASTVGAAVTRKLVEDCLRNY